MTPEPIDIPAIREVGILRLYLTPPEVSRLLTTLRARADVRVEDVRGPPYTAVRRVYVLHLEPEAIEVWQVEDHIGFRRDDSAPTDRRLQVIARLIDAAGMVAEDAKDLVAMTRADYPDVFVDLDSHLRQVRGVATTEPDATVIDEPADPAIWAQTSERAQAAALAGESPPAMAGPYEVSERLQRLDEFVADPRTLEEALAEAAANVARLDRKRPPDADPLTGELPKRAALMPREIYVDDIIGGVPTVRLTPPDGEPITFSLSAEGARVLGLALLSSAEISKVTGWGIPTSQTPPHTLAELRQRLEALPIRALLIIPTSLDHAVIDAHLPGVFDGKAIRFASGATLRILRGRPEPRQIAGLAVDVAMVLTAVPAETLAEIRMALLRSGGTLFAPFSVELAGADEDPFFAVARAASAAQASINAAAAVGEALADDLNEVQQRVRAAIPAIVLETGGACPCAECGGVMTVGVLTVSVSGLDRAIQCSTASCVRWLE